MVFIAAGVSVVGPGHIEMQLPNQDAISLKGRQGGWIGSVADGLGSKSKSDLGSMLACHSVQQVLRQQGIIGRTEELLEKIHQKWIKAITPYSPEDTATTLLLANVATNGETLVAQLGDGMILMRSEGKFACLTGEREGYSNQTFAMGIEHRQKLWRWATVKLANPGDGIVLMTDGISDDIERENLHGFMEAIYINLIKKSKRNGKKWLKSELINWPTPMHNDDKSLIAIFRAGS
jgi:serine/threonine protein phosphatase PrpC